jgi:hypothetical protein
MQQYLDKYNDTTGIGMGIKRVNGVSLAVRKLRPSLLGILQICSPNTNKQYFIPLEFKPMVSLDSPFTIIFHDYFVFGNSTKRNDN